MRILLATDSAPLEVLIRRSLARFQYQWQVTGTGLDAFQKAVTEKFDLLILDTAVPRMGAVEILRRLASIENFKTPPAIVLTFSEEDRAQVESEHFPQTEVVPRPMVIRKFVSTVQQILEREMRVTCLGGGTGLFTLLLGLKTLSGVQLSSVVAMSDDGGSTGRLRDMFGILPPGDVRRSLVALSTAPDLLNELMQYRFEKGKELEGHNLGNLLLTALTEMRGTMTQAVRSLGEILNIQGQVIPVTETFNTLHAQLEDGKIISGEHRIDLFEDTDPKIKISKIWQEPRAEGSPDAIEAIMNAKFVLLGPGDLFTSVIPNVIVSGIAEAIAASKAKKIYICNVMTKPGETTDFQVSDHVREMVRYLGRDVLDYVLCSSTEFSETARSRYLVRNQIPVTEKDPLVLQRVTNAKIWYADLASEAELVRHDSLKLAAELKKIFETEKPEGTKD